MQTPGIQARECATKSKDIIAIVKKKKKKKHLCPLWQPAKIQFSSTLKQALGFSVWERYNLASLRGQDILIKGRIKRNIYQGLTLFYLI